MISNADVGGKKYLNFEEFLNLMIKKVDYRT